jgi:hypothetical protein
MGLELFAAWSAGASRTLMTGQAPGGASPPVGVGQDPVHLLAAQEALTASWP